MFGFGKRNRELEAEAKNATTKLLEEAVFEDRRRRGDTNEAPPSPDECSSTIAAWFATARHAYGWKWHGFLRLDLEWKSRALIHFGNA